MINFQSGRKVQKWVPTLSLNQGHVGKAEVRLKSVTFQNNDFLSSQLSLENLLEAESSQPLEAYLLDFDADYRHKTW